MLAPSPTTHARPVRIVIADDHPIFIDGFCAALRKHKHIVVAGTGTNGLQLVQLVEKHKPDIAFADVKMPVMDGIAATKEIKKRFPDTKVIAISGFADDCYITDMMIEVKASGYLLKEAHKNEILKAIDCVLNGEIYCSEEVSKKLVKLSQRTETNPMKPFAKPSLTEKEVAVLIENAKGLSTKQIGHVLNMEPGAVESAKRRLFEKTGCSNSVELARYAYANFIVPL